MMDPKTLEQAGQFGRELADQLTGRVTLAIEGIQGSEPAQRAAIARIVAARLRAYANEQAGEL